VKQAENREASWLKEVRKVKRIVKDRKVKSGRQDPRGGKWKKKLW
jgi:hypothetical protein